MLLEGLTKPGSSMRRSQGHLARTSMIMGSISFLWQLSSLSIDLIQRAQMAIQIIDLSSTMDRYTAPVSEN